MCVLEFFCKNPNLRGKGLAVELPQMAGKLRSGVQPTWKEGQQKKEMRKRKERRSTLRWKPG